MHPALAAFADRYRHAFPDLVIRDCHKNDVIVCEWQEGPEALCCEVVGYGFAESDLIAFGGFHNGARSRGRDAIGALVESMYLTRLMAMRGPWTMFLATPGTFGALVLERRLLTPPIRPNSPDQLN